MYFTTNDNEVNILDHRTPCSIPSVPFGRKIIGNTLWICCHSLSTIRMSDEDCKSLAIIVPLSWHGWNLFLEFHNCSALLVCPLASSGYSGMFYRRTRIFNSEGPPVKRKAIIVLFASVFVHLQTWLHMIQIFSKQRGKIELEIKMISSCDLKIKLIEALLEIT